MQPLITQKLYIFTNWTIHNCIYLIYYIILFYHVSFRKCGTCTNVVYHNYKLLLYQCDKVTYFHKTCLIRFIGPYSQLVRVQISGIYLIKNTVEFWWLKWVQLVTQMTVNRLCWYSVNYILKVVYLFSY
jgi:hypothetical protein